MGFSISWCAVREEGAQKLLDRFGLTPTGETEEIPESPFSTVRLGTGWRVIWSNEWECPFFKDEDLAAASIDEDILLCRVEEHVMSSSAEYWSGGKRTWWLAHDGDQGPKGIESSGQFPPEYEAIRREMEDAQRAEGGDEAGVDYFFEIPVRVAQSVVGFKHDEVTEEAFSVLAWSFQKKGFLGRLFS